MCLWLRIIWRSNQSVQFINFHSQIFFNNINHDNRAALLKKNPLWLLAFHMLVATDCYYEKVHRTMCNVIVLCLLNWFYIFYLCYAIHWQFNLALHKYYLKPLLSLIHHIQINKKQLLKTHNIDFKSYINAYITPWITSGRLKSNKSKKNLHQKLSFILNFHFLI